MEKVTNRKTIKERAKPTHPVTRQLVITGRERLTIWERVQGMWKHRTPDPITELEQMHNEWEPR